MFVCKYYVCIYKEEICHSVYTYLSDLFYDEILYILLYCTMCGLMPCKRN